MMYCKEELEEILHDICGIGHKLNSFQKVLRELETEAMMDEVEKQDKYFLMTFCCDHIEYILARTNACADRMNSYILDALRSECAL